MTETNQTFSRETIEADRYAIHNCLQLQGLRPNSSGPIRGDYTLALRKSTRDGTRFILSLNNHIDELFGIDIYDMIRTLNLQINIKINLS